MPNNFRDDLIEVFEAVSKAQLNTLRRLRRRTSQQARLETAPARSMSQIDTVYDILRSAARPMPISEIMTQAAKRHQVSLDRESIVSALAKRVARQDRFARTGPNTFAILPERER